MGISNFAPCQSFANGYMWPIGGHILVMYYTNRDRLTIK